MRGNVGCGKILWVIGWNMCGVEGGGNVVGDLGGRKGGGGGWGYGKPRLTRWKVVGVGRGNGCLLGGGEGVGGGIVFTFFLCRLESRRLHSFRGFFGFSLQVGIRLDPSPEARVSCLNASISSALRFFRSASSSCIFAWPFRMAAKSGVMLGGSEGPASTCLFAPALLRVETIFREKRVLKVFVSCPTVGANCSCREQIR